jgi:hypothetical protein
VSTLFSVISTDQLTLVPLVSSTILRGPYGRHYVRVPAVQHLLWFSLRILFFSLFFLSLTNDGNAILCEIDVAHPAAKNMIELSRTQDEEYCGDGTTSVIVLGTSAACIYTYAKQDNDDS